ncbi:MAG TPA: alpha-L-rhamnosidase C-terminal domain-containing protein, partial [Kribbella sp.]|nr:alpha-L-rhamnosidase C-terminal domain-containing protein [Kribbella sp.]
RLFRKAISEFALTRTVCPGLLAVAPGHRMQEIADFSLQWPLQLLTYYRYTGDLDFLGEMVEIADGILDHFRTFARADGLLSDVVDKWNLVDWPEGMRDGYDFPLGQPVGPGCHNVVNAFYYGCVDAVQQIKDILGIPYRDELPRLRDAFLRTFLGAGELFTDAELSSHSSLHANILPLYFALAPDPVVPRIVSMIRERRLNCGTYFSYFLLNALTAHGEAALAYELIGGDDPNSWSTMLKEGATACCEVWSKDQKWNTSLCHGWASAPIPVLIEGIVGLHPEKPGWTEIRFAPQIPQGMAPFQLTVPTPAGPIKVQYDGHRAALTAPPGVIVH